MEKPTAKTLTRMNNWKKLQKNKDIKNGKEASLQTQNIPNSLMSII